MKEIRGNARKLMENFCRVCPVCNGRACAGEVPGMGELGSGSSFVGNVSALADCKFNMRLIHDVIEPDTNVNILGKNLALGAEAVMIGRPFSIAAIGGGQAGVEKFIEQLHGELKQAMVLTGTRSAAAVDRTILYNSR